MFDIIKFNLEMIILEYKTNYLYDYGKNYIEAICLEFEKIIVNIFLDRKSHRLDIKIIKKEKINRKKINLLMYIQYIIDYISKNQILCKKDDSVFKEDILKLNKVKSLELINLKIEDIDIKLINDKFKNLRDFNTKNCTLYSNCNLGILKCNIYDFNSDIYGLDMFNGFEGNILRLTRSNIKRINKNVLNLNNIITIFRGIDIDYEYFFLTTSAPNMRKLEIYRSPKYSKLKNNDLLFISGFYNLESISIDGVVTNYEQINKLEKLRKIDRLFCLDEKQYEVVKRKQTKYFNHLIENNVSASRLQNFLMLNRMVIQNQYQELFHKLYVPRLERVKWEDKITKNDLERIREELIKIQEMSSKDRKNISREVQKKFNLFDDLYDLWFDKYPKQDDDIIERYSRSFQSEEIKYYTLNKKIHIDE